MCKYRAGCFLNSQDKEELFTNFNNLGPMKYLRMIKNAGAGWQQKKKSLNLRLVVHIQLL